MNDVGLKIKLAKTKVMYNNELIDVQDIIIKSTTLVLVDEYIDKQNRFSTSRNK